MSGMYCVPAMCPCMECAAAIAGRAGPWLGQAPLQYIQHHYHRLNNMKDNYNNNNNNNNNNNIILKW